MFLTDVVLNVWCLCAEHRGCSTERRMWAAYQGHRDDEGPGPVAQWTTRLTTDQEIAGSTPAWLDTFNLSGSPTASFGRAFLLLPIFHPPRPSAGQKFWSTLLCCRKERVPPDLVVELTPEEH